MAVTRVVELLELEPVVIVVPAAVFIAAAVAGVKMWRDRRDDRRRGRHP